MAAAGGLASAAGLSPARDAGGEVRVQAGAGRRGSRSTSVLPSASPRPAPFRLGNALGWSEAGEGKWEETVGA